jgi:hypothetical protein
MEYMRQEGTERTGKGAGRSSVSPLLRVRAVRRNKHSPYLLGSVAPKVAVSGTPIGPTGM